MYENSPRVVSQAVIFALLVINKIKCGKRSAQNHMNTATRVSAICHLLLG
jgi:hypothetical protein